MPKQPEKVVPGIHASWPGIRQLEQAAATNVLSCLSRAAAGNARGAAPVRGTTRQWSPSAFRLARSFDILNLSITKYLHCCPASRSHQQFNIVVFSLNLIPAQTETNHALTTVFDVQRHVDGVIRLVFQIPAAE
jgi:hypothetical protein